MKFWILYTFIIGLHVSNAFIPAAPSRLDNNHHGSFSSSFSLSSSAANKISSQMTLSSLSMSTTSSSSSVELLPTIREGVAELYQDAGMDEWNKCLSILMKETTNGSDDDDNKETAEALEMALATALNWKGWAVSSPGMRKFIPKPNGPDAAKVESSMNWLKQGGPLKFTTEQIRAAIIDHPRIFLLNAQGTYEKSLSVAPKEYKNDPDKFNKLILEDFSAMGNTYNCADGGCASECGNCWVTYQKAK